MQIPSPPRREKSERLPRRADLWGMKMELSPREAEVLSLLAYGCSYSRIGDRLGVSINTVTTHIKNIYRKLEVHCAAAAVRRGIELHLGSDVQAISFIRES